MTKIVAYARIILTVILQLLDRFFPVNVDGVVAGFVKVEAKLAKAESQAIARAAAISQQRSQLAVAQVAANDDIARAARVRERVSALIA